MVKRVTLEFYKNDGLYCVDIVDNAGNILKTIERSNPTILTQDISYYLFDHSDGLFV